ncbi:MFS transporter [Streptomyces sp. SCSIO 30461]|uniref:MFS transporter n=1 Tax=Streptomyces sp. SCSIO 30461 TaxID=3118085 RepID=UPI0030CED83D
MSDHSEGAESAGPAVRLGVDRVLLVGIFLALSLSIIDGMVVSIAAPTMAADLDLSSAGIRWVVNSYTLARAATFALGGRLADVYGPRRVLLAGLAVFVIASVLCGFAPQEAGTPWLVACRVAQGAGGGVMYPAAMALVVAEFPVHQRGRALATLFGCSQLLSALGLPLGGWLTTLSWRWVFWINLPIGVGALALIAIARGRNDIGQRGVSQDLKGAALLAAGMTTSVLALEQAALLGWSDPVTLLLIVSGPGALALFVLREKRTPFPLIDIRLFRDRCFALDMSILFFSTIAYMPMLFFASFYAQLALRDTAVQAGVYLLFFQLAYSVGAQFGGQLQDRVGVKPALLIGAGLGTAGFALWALQLRELSVSAQWPFIAMAGMGVGLVVPPAATDAYGRAGPEASGMVGGVVQTTRIFSGALGLALLGSVFSDVAQSRVTSTLKDMGMAPGAVGEAARQLVHFVSDDQGDRLQSSVGGVQLTPAIQETIRLDIVRAHQWVFMAMALAAAMAFCCALLHPGSRPAGTGPGSAADARHDAES